LRHDVKANKGPFSLPTLSLVGEADMNKLKKWFLAAFIILIPGTTNAIGLGQMDALSTLGQPFHAEIGLIGVHKEELASLSARLALRDDYQRAGLNYNATAASFILDLQKRSNGEPYIRIISARPVTEFVVTVLIDVTWTSGRVIRAYTVPLNPPKFE
jgi:Tfp pilus assembly protein FimV